MTVDHGRLWHRVAQNQKVGIQRRSLFIAYLTDEQIMETENSKPVFYQRSEPRSVESRES